MCSGPVVLCVFSSLPPPTSALFHTNKKNMDVPYEDLENPSHINTDVINGRAPMKKKCESSENVARLGPKLPGSDYHTTI